MSTVLKASRESQRTRSLALSTQARTRHNLRHPSAKSSAPPHSSQAPYPLSKGVLKLQLHLVDDALDVHVEDLPAESSPAEPLGLLELTRPRERAIEVSFADLAVSSKRTKHPSGDFQIVPRFKSVIALDDSCDFGSAGQRAVVEAATASSSDDDDEWELLDMGEEVEKGKAKKTTKSWASIVGA